MSDPTVIFNEILNFLVTVFFATPPTGGLSMYQTLATTYSFSVSGNNCTLDNLNLSGVTTNPTTGSCEACSSWWPQCAFVKGPTKPCSGLGVIVTLGTLQGLAGLQITAGEGSFDKTSGICTITFKSCKIPNMIYNNGNYSVGGCLVVCGDCNQGYTQQCSYASPINFFSPFQPFNAPVYSDVTFNLQTILTSTQLGLDFSKSTISFNNMNIDYFPHMPVGVPYIPSLQFDIGNYLNQQLGIFVESKIPSSLLQSLPNIIIPTGILVDGKQGILLSNGTVSPKLLMRSPIHTFTTQPFYIQKTGDIPYLFIRNPADGRIITNFDRNFRLNIVNNHSAHNEDDEKFFSKGNNVKSIENFFPKGNNVKSTENFSYY